MYSYIFYFELYFYAHRTSSTSPATMLVAHDRVLPHRPQRHLLQSTAGAMIQTPVLAPHLMGYHLMENIAIVSRPSRDTWKREEKDTGLFRGLFLPRDINFLRLLPLACCLQLWKPRLSSQNSNLQPDVLRRQNDRIGTRQVHGVDDSDDAARNMRGGAH